MAGLRKGHCYTKVVRAYTRKSKFKAKAYIKGVPPNKIVKYDQGNLQKAFETDVHLCTKNPIQIRHNALESARQIVSRHASLLMGNNFRLKVRVYPHHVLRENKMLSGAGADRMQTGMQRAFGKPIGAAAQVKRDQAIFTLYVDKKDTENAKKILQKAIQRLPGHYYVQ